MKLKHINVAEREVFQDALKLRTKFAKSFPTWFFPVGDDIRAIVEDWVGFLETEMLFGRDDPLFPATEVAHANSRLFEPVGLSHRHWSTANRIRQIFKQAFLGAGLSYFNPDIDFETLWWLSAWNFAGGISRLSKLGRKISATEKLLMTLTSYGNIAPKRQADIICGLGRTRSGGRRVGDGTGTRQRRSTHTRSRVADGWIIW